VPLDATTTTLGQTGGGGPAGPVSFTGTVTDTTNAAHNPVNAGTVSLFDNGSTSPFASGAVTSAGTFSIPFTYTAAGSHSVVATYSGNATEWAGSSSAPVTFSETAPACTTCNDTQTIEGTVPAGTLSISTPYTPSNPLNLGTLQLSPGGAYFFATAPLDGNSSDVPTQGASPDPTFNGITVVDTQSGNLPWTVTATSSNLSDGSGHPNGVINGENVGLTGVTPVLVPGNAIAAGDVNVFDHAAANPPVSPTDPGTLGLKGGPTIASDTLQPDGTVGINGTVTLNAPTSTEAGTFIGTITFTISS
jgi:Bacterial Ig-like domain (group 3)